MPPAISGSSISLDSLGSGSETLYPSMTSTTVNLIKPQKPLTELDLDILTEDLVETQVFQSCLDLQRPSADGIEDDLVLKLPKAFRSLCLCDLNSSGYPVLLRSKYFSNTPRGLKSFPEEFIGGFKTGECIVSDRPDASGRPRFILQYFQGLISRETATMPFVLAAQMDITDAMRVLTTELLPFVRPASSISTKGGDGEDNIDWIALANDASPSPPPKLSASLKSLANFHDYVKDLAFFHRSALILSPATQIDTPRSQSRLSIAHSPSLTDDDFFDARRFWQISYASPHLCARPEDLEAALMMTDPEDLHSLAEKFASGKPVAARVRWGITGTEMWMYCVPMIRGREMDCYLAFLVDASVGNLWAVEG